MLQKKAYYVMQAIQSGCTEVEQIVEYIRNSDYVGYLYNYHVRAIINELHKYRYITKEIFWRSFVVWVLKSVRSQSEIQFD